MARRFILLVIIDIVPLGVHVLSAGFLGTGLLALDFGLLAWVPICGRRIPGATLAGGLISVLAAPVDR